MIESIELDDLEARFDHLAERFGREQVGKGSIEAFFGATASGTMTVGKKFLDRINDWRLRLANGLHTRYPVLEFEALSDLVQKVINRIVFIRMCEDRGIEGVETLRSVAGKQDVVELQALFKTLDERYNSKLFDVALDGHPNPYVVDAALFHAIVDEVYSPTSPYSFAVLDADFLGQVYELFLAKQLLIVGTVVSLVNKPTYEGREVVTTPQLLVDEVVQRAIDARISCKAVKNFKELLELRILDIAVDSGRFLIHALDKLVDLAIELLSQTPNDPRLYEVYAGNYRLCFDAKKKLLENCLFGIDIDFNAVEVARFSLMVKLLEDETVATLPVGKKILPNLDRNVIYGNSVVQRDFVPPTSADCTLPIDWSKEGLPGAFDVIIGNPPYVMTKEMREKTPAEFAYYKQRYTTPFQQFDKYFVFVERALEKVADNGSIGLIIPNKWMTIEAGSKLRALLSKGNVVSDIVDFGNESLFAGKSTYVCMLVLKKAGATAFAYRNVHDQAAFELTPAAPGYSHSSSVLHAVGENAWLLPSDANEQHVLATLAKSSARLGTLAKVKNGIQTSLNDVFVIKNYTDHGATVTFSRKGVAWHIEKDITRPYVDDSKKGVRSYCPVLADALVVFPYDSISGLAPKAMDPTRLKANFPLAWKYLNNFHATLVKRSVAPKQPPGVFYAFGRHQALETVFTSPKIVYTVNQLGDKYGYDDIGVAVASGGTAGEVMLLDPRAGYALEFFLGLLNQRAIEFFVRKRGSAFGNGYYSRGTAVVADVPVPSLDLFHNPAHVAAHQSIVENVKAILGLNKKLAGATGRARTVLDRDIIASEASLKASFDALWGFTDEQDNLILPGE